MVLAGTNKVLEQNDSGQRGPMGCSLLWWEDPGGGEGWKDGELNGGAGKAKGMCVTDCAGSVIG